MASNDWSSWYGRPWRRLRDAHLNANPLCVFCKRQGRVVAAEVVDHIDPHRGDRAKFEDPNNLQSLCKRCHDSHKQSQEKTGRVRGCDVDGVPIDRNHHWSS